MKDLAFPFRPRPWIVVGLVAAVLAVIGVIFSGFAVFIQAYLYAYLFWLGISLGCLAIVMLVYLVNSSWGRISRWVLEASAKVLWLMLLLFVPIAVGLPQLYPWARPAEVAASSLLQHKTLYLNVPFFLIRAALYFALWIFFASRLSAMAQQEKYYQDFQARRVFQRVAAIGLLVYGLTMTFASIDWMMSLNPDWYSTIYGMMAILTQALSAFAFLLVVLPGLSKYEPLAGLVTTTNIRDLGALLLTSVLTLAYLAFSQLLIIWSGDLPHEVTWYLDRATGGWVWVELFVVIFQFALPFMFLISLRAKQNPRLLAGLSILILVMRLFDSFWMVMPVFSPGHFSLHWLDLVLPVAIGGFWLAGFAWFLGRTPVLSPQVSLEPAEARREARPESRPAA